MKIQSINNINVIIIILGFNILFSCNSDTYSPKPRTYFRIELPLKSYQLFDTNFPYTFEYPKYSSIITNYNSFNEKYWVNIFFSQFNATIHLTYKKINNNLDSLLSDSKKFVDKHIPKASSIKEKSYTDKNQNIYCMVYDIKGNEVASPYQFYATDMKKHFIRGALYFNSEPNNDSLSPVIEYIEKDIDHLINTLKWK